ncbi:MAG: hypothetical protein U1F98_10140 [Verrucomicrobiota bacterium]
MTSPISRILLGVAAIIGGCSASGFDASTLAPVGLGLGSNPYWNRPAFANALWAGEGWLEFTNGQWGSPVYFENNPQFDTNGFPRYLHPGAKLRAVLFALNANPYPRPSTWPDRTALACGKVVVTWKGDADIRAGGGTYLAAESSGGDTGCLVNGRRVYRFSGSSRFNGITVEDIHTNNPVTDIKVWLPDPADPDNRALENQLFHPAFLARLGDAPWAFLRCMDWNDSNASPQRDWADRRLPSHAFQDGVLNRRSPATGFSGDRGTGIAFEYMVAAANASGHDLWITVPHLASDDFITKLAQLIRYGSDGVNPYTNTVSNPVYAPLNSNRRVFVEYSNEIWSNGDAFCQGNWAQAQADTLGITKPQFNARRFCQAWRLFQIVFAGDTSRVVRAAAVFTGFQGYTDPFLSEIAAYGPTLSPPQTADVIAPTTYFGNGIQDWAYAKARQQAATSDPWFLTTNTFTDGAAPKPVSVPAADPYWTGTNVSRHLAETFAEWKRRLLSGATQTGGGPDATGVGGGFDAWLRTSISNAFGGIKPIVAYEGGPSLYTDYLDGGDVRDDAITTFLELLNRQPQMAEVYRIHLNLALAKGLRTHSAFVDVSSWGKYGQWGHLEYAGQDPNAAVKWRFIRDWPAEINGLRSIDDPAGSVPRFVTSAKLPIAVFRQPYSQDILVTNGDGVLKVDLIDCLLSDGLAVTHPDGNPARLRISGTPLAAGDSFVYVRAVDADGDPAWRTFYFNTAGGPGTILECNLEGSNPALNLPWKPVYVLQSGAVFSGWTAGAGIAAASGNDALTWSQNMPAEEASSTLAAALAARSTWSFTLAPPPGKPLDLRNAEVRFTLRRIDYHAPRDYAVFTSIGGITNGAQVFDTGRFTDDTDREFAFQLPGAGAYSNITSAVTFQVAGYAGQYAGHKTSLRGFKLTVDTAALAPFARWKAGFGIADDAAASSDDDHDGLPLLLEYALSLDPTKPDAAGLPAGAVENGFLTLSYNQSRAATDIVCLAEVAGSPAGSWSSAAADVDQAWSVAEEGGTETIVARDRTPVSAAIRRFMRLKVSGP